MKKFWRWHITPKYNPTNPCFFLRQKNQLSSSASQATWISTRNTRTSSTSTNKRESTTPAIMKNMWNSTSWSGIISGWISVGIARLSLSMATNRRFSIFSFPYITSLCTRGCRNSNNQFSISSTGFSQSMRGSLSGISVCLAVSSKTTASTISSTKQDKNRSLFICYWKGL